MKVRQGLKRSGSCNPECPFGAPAGLNPGLSASSIDMFIFY
jgi:hypothetical protein